jgi:hypothetical protein
MSLQRERIGNVVYLDDYRDTDPRSPFSGVPMHIDESVDIDDELLPWQSETFSIGGRRCA